MTRAEFKGAMAMLGASYNRELTAPVLRLYWSQFQHVLPDDFRDAVTECIRTMKYFPTIADLRDRLGLNVQPSLAEGGAVFAALTEAKAPHYDPHRGGYWTYSDVMQVHGTQAVAAFMAAGGMQAFQARTDRDLPFLRKAFMDGWTDAGKRPDLQASLADLHAHHRLNQAPRGLAPLSASLPRLLPGEPESVS